MEEIHGFPVTFGGGEKYTKKDLAFVMGDLALSGGDLQMVQGIDGLAQHIEHAVLSLPKEDLATPEGAAKAMVPAVRELHGQHLERIVAVRAEGREMEIDFVAVGYEGKYTKRLNLDGPGGLHPARRTG